MIATRRDIFRLPRWKESRGKPEAEHHFRFVQLPLNLAMPEALLRPNQSGGRKNDGHGAGRTRAGNYARNKRDASSGTAHAEPALLYRCRLGLKNDAARALQFARSVPGVTTALVGMSRVEHVHANLEIVGVEPAPRDQFLKLFESNG